MLLRVFAIGRGRSYTGGRTQGVVHMVCVGSFWRMYGANHSVQRGCVGRNGRSKQRGLYRWVCKQQLVVKTDGSVQGVCRQKREVKTEGFEDFVIEFICD